VAVNHLLDLIATRTAVASRTASPLDLINARRASVDRSADTGLCDDSTDANVHDCAGPCVEVRATITMLNIDFKTEPIISFIT
jgi:hypothetical protein